MRTRPDYKVISLVLFHIQYKAIITHAELAFLRHLLADIWLQIALGENKLSSLITLHVRQSVNIDSRETLFGRQIRVYFPSFHQTHSFAKLQSFIHERMEANNLPQKYTFFRVSFFFGGGKNGEKNVKSCHGMVSIAQHICTLLGFYILVVQLVNSCLSDTENRVLKIFLSSSFPSHGPFFIRDQTGIRGCGFWHLHILARVRVRFAGGLGMWKWSSLLRNVIFHSSFRFQESSPSLPEQLGQQMQAFLLLRQIGKREQEQGELHGSSNMTPFSPSEKLWRFAFPFRRPPIPALERNSLVIPRAYLFKIPSLKMRTKARSCILIRRKIGQQ